MRDCVRLSILSASLLMAIASSAAATQPPSAVVSDSKGWESTVSRPDGASGGAFSDQDLASIKTVSDYFNTLKSLQARFVQTDPDQTETRGKVFVAKPGKFRFEYAKPSRKVVISDGRFLAVQDLDLDTDETYELTNTPFRMLLRDNVDLMRDAEVLQVETLPQQVSLVLRDKDPDVPAAIKVVVTTQPEVALRGWITRDAQGLETKVELSEVQHGADLDEKLFVREKLFMKKVK